MLIGTHAQCANSANGISGILLVGFHSAAGRTRFVGFHHYSHLMQKKKIYLKASNRQPFGV